MANYNIEMQYYNGSRYDTLRPRTVLNNITDWSNNIYSKSEIDTNIYTKSQTNSLFNNYYNKSEIDNLLEDTGGSSSWELYRSYPINLTGNQSTVLINNNVMIYKYDWFFRYDLTTLSVLPQSTNCGLAINQSIFAYWIPKNEETSTINISNISDYYFYTCLRFYSNIGYYSDIGEQWPIIEENKLNFIGYNNIGTYSNEVIYTYNKSGVSSKNNSFILNFMNGGSSARAVGTLYLYRKPNILTELGLDIVK